MYNDRIDRRKDRHINSHADGQMDIWTGEQTDQQSTDSETSQAVSI